MHNLVHMYAAKKVLTRPEKERKIQLCVIVLETLVKIDPGYTKWRGTLLQEMIHSVMVSTHPSLEEDLSLKIEELDQTIWICILEL